MDGVREHIEKQQSDQLSLSFELEKLTKLVANGHLTPKEFTDAKQKLLSPASSPSVLTTWLEYGTAALGIAAVLVIATWAHITSDNGSLSVLRDSLTVLGTIVGVHIGARVGRGRER